MPDPYNPTTANEAEGRPNCGDPACDKWPCREHAPSSSKPCTEPHEYRDGVETLLDAGSSSKPCTEGEFVPFEPRDDITLTDHAGFEQRRGCTEGGEHCFCVNVSAHLPYEGRLSPVCCWWCLGVSQEPTRPVPGHGPGRTELVVSDTYDATGANSDAPSMAPQGPPPWSVRVPAAIARAKDYFAGRRVLMLDAFTELPDPAWKRELTANQVALAEALWENGHDVQCVGNPSCCSLVDEGSALIAFTEKVESLDA